MIPKNEVSILSEQERNLINTHCVDIFEVPLLGDDKAVYYIKKSGEVLKDAFSWIGSVTSKGVNIAGDFINQKLSGK